MGEAGTVLVSLFEYPSPHIFPGGSDGKESACNVENGFDPWLGRSPGERNGYPSIYLTEESHGRRSLMDYSLWGPKELYRTERLTN